MTEIAEDVTEARGSRGAHNLSRLGFVALALSSILLYGLKPATSVAAGVPVGIHTNTRIACFGPESNRYIGRVEPPVCEIWGRLDHVTYPEGEGREQVEPDSFYRAKFRDIEWLKTWGRPLDRGLATLSGSGRGVTIDAYRKVTCGNDSTWYSRVNVFKDTHVLYELRLPVCGRSLHSLSSGRRDQLRLIDPTTGET